MNDDPNLSRTFLNFSRRKLMEEFWPRTCQCLDMLTDEQVWWRPNEQCNSIGNLLLHLNGNVRQWILAPLGGTANQRNRPAEFAERQTIPAHELRDRLDRTLREVEKVLKEIDSTALLKAYDIQDQKGVTGLEAVYQVVEHFGRHHGQILYITKQLTGNDLGFYRHLDGR